MDDLSPSVYEDEIDLREIVLTLWGGRGLIAGLTVGAALLALALSLWVLPEKYRATAFIAVKTPAIQLNAAQGDLSIRLNTPDLRALPDLVLSPAFLDQVAADPRVAALFNAAGETLPDDLEDYVEVSTTGASLLILEVTDGNPQRSAAIANVWAERATQLIESVYGLGVISNTLDAQISQAEQNYVAAQANLETFLAQDQTPILQTRLNVRREFLACLDRRLRAATAISDRLDGLAAELDRSSQTISLSNALVLASIQQDIETLETCGGDGAAILASSPLQFQELTNAGASNIAAGLSENLQQRISATQEEQSEIQQEVLELTVTLEQLAFERDKFTRQRDQARDLVSQLTEQKTILDGILRAGGRVAEVAGVARVPDEAAFPRPLLNTAIGTMMGGALAVSWILVRKWWREDQAGPTPA